MISYRFVHLTPDGMVTDEQVRELSDDFAAVAWMGREALARTEHLEAFRVGEAEPFARRYFAENVTVFG